MTGPDLRPLGTFERIAAAVASRRPYQYCLVARLDRDPGAGRLAVALSAVQRSHPLLRVEVAPGGGGMPAFRATDRPIAVDVAPADAPWERVAAEQVARWIRPDHGPLVRAVLIPASDGTSRIGLTVCHVATDGMGALRMLLDLTRALDGQALPAHAFPPSQESFAGSERIAAAGRNRDAGSTAGMPADPREPPPFRPFDGAPATVAAVELDEDLTAALLAASRAHGTTLQPVLAAAAAVVLSRAGRRPVDVGTAFDLRRAADLPDDVADRFLGAHTVTEDAAAQDFWALVARTAAELEAGTSPRTVDAALSAMAAVGPISGDEADAGLRQDTHADVLITNLGVLRPPATKNVHLLSVEPPVLVMHVEGEQVVGVLTSGGRLRLVLTAYDPEPGLLAGLESGLVAIADGRTP